MAIHPPVCRAHAMPASTEAGTGVYTFRHVHGSQKMTSMCFDTELRRLITRSVGPTCCHGLIRRFAFCGNTIPASQAIAACCHMLYASACSHVPNSSIRVIVAAAWTAPSRFGTSRRASRSESHATAPLPHRVTAAALLAANRTEQCANVRQCAPMWTAAGTLERFGAGCFL